MKIFISIGLLLTLLSLSGSRANVHQYNHGTPSDSVDSNSDNNLRIEFEAHRVGNDVELKWAVTGFVQYFYIERSLDKESWEPILKMSGSNETYHRTQYFDIDYDVPSSKLFYRIKQVFYSGETSSSNVAFVPAYDDLMDHEERLIKTISDPIREGLKINLFFMNFQGEDLLLVLRDQCNMEYYAKVKYLPNEALYLVTDVSGDIPSGQYLITASSKKHIYSSELRIELSE